MRLHMHDTVPAGVRELASSAEWLEKLTSGRPEVGMRIVSASYPEMRDVWARVCEHQDPDVPTLFFHAVLELPARWERLPKTGTKVYQANVATVAAAAETLADLLDRHQSEIDFARGSRLTFHHVQVRARTIRQELVGKSRPPDGWLYALGESAQPLPTLPDFIRALAQELRPLREPRETLIRPTRIAGENAARTFMVRSLAVFLRDCFGSPLFAVVAGTVNTVLDDPTNPLDANHAAKLAADLF